MSAAIILRADLTIAVTVQFNAALDCGWSAEAVVTPGVGLEGASGYHPNPYRAIQQAITEAMKVKDS